MALILVVEDEPDLARTLEYNLRREGHETRHAATGGAALEFAFGSESESPTPDLVLLDLMLPDIPGTEVCKRLRSEPRTRAVAIIMLTAKDQEIDRVVGFELGADDYVAKPYSTRELMLRVQAVLRRRGGATSNPPEETSFGALRIDRDGYRVWVDGEETTLTALEFRLLVLLVERRGRVQTREGLLSDVWGIDADVTTRTVDTHVKRLRQKLGAAGAYIETLRGVGYRCRSTPSEEGA